MKSMDNVIVLSEHNPTTDVRYCHDCVQYAQHVEETGGFYEWYPEWVSVPVSHGVERMHIVEKRREPSRKYPEGTGPYFACGRHR